MSTDDVAVLLYQAYLTALIKRPLLREVKWSDLPEETRRYWRAVASTAISLAPALV